MPKHSDFVDWDRLRVFHAVVEAGSFTKAGRKLQLSQSAVSRQICSLEESLTVPLFYRHARGLVLTEQGEEFYRSVQEMQSHLSKGLARIAEARAQAEGPLRITTTVTFGSAWLSSRVARFHKQYPDISLSVILVDSPELDLFSRQADVAIRFSEQTDGRLIQRRLMSIRYHLFASKEYLDQHGRLSSVQDLDKHQLIVYGNELEAPWKNFDWILTEGCAPGRVRRAALKINSVYGIYRAVKSGLGIAALPYYVVDDSPNIEEVLPEIVGPSNTAYFVYPEDLRGSKRVAVIREFLMQQVREELGDLATEPPSDPEDDTPETCDRCGRKHRRWHSCVFG
jgi:DNA-binding transcriptional LysR family regulator